MYVINATKHPRPSSLVVQSQQPCHVLGSGWPQVLLSKHHDLDKVVENLNHGALCNPNHLRVYRNILSKHTELLE